MTGLRNNQGWLTAEALKAGEREQWATETRHGRVLVEIFYDPDSDPNVLPMPWRVQASVTSQGSTHIRGFKTFRLNVARKKFTELKRRHEK